jgi:hypothetical protein
MTLIGLEKQTTFALAKELVLVQRRLDSLIRGPAWWSPYRFGRKRWIEREKNRSAEYTAALVDRYRGLFVQIYNGLSVRGGSPNRPFVDFFETWWDHVEAPIMGVQSSDHVSRLFWEAAEFAANVTFGSGSTSIELLRPKFMLRPLIDEIPDAAGRDVLRSLAYDTQVSSALSSLSTVELYRVVMAACEALYGLLAAQRDKMAHLTDGTVDASLLRDETKAVAQLRQWLFGPW